MTLDGGEVGGGGCEVAIIIDAVASDGETDSFLFFLLRADGGNCSAVRGLFVFWLECMIDEEHRIRALRPSIT